MKARLERETRQGRANVAADSWFMSYQMALITGKTPENWPVDSVKKIHEGLQELGQNPDPNEVDRIIGNNTWTHLCCDSCREYCPNGVIIAEVCIICDTCLLTALGITTERMVPLSLGCPAGECDGKKIDHADLLGFLAKIANHPDCKP